MVKWIVVMKIQPSICLDDWGKPRKNLSQVGRHPHRDLDPGPPECESRALPRSHLARLFLVLFLHFRRKTRLIKWGSVCVCLCVSVCECVCVCVCVQFWSPPSNSHISYAIDTKFWLHIVSYRNSRTPLIPFLNFENCVRKNFWN